ncbi:protoporphyrinogen/coproporphyrinogen oxidase [Chitinasiproducens palmae]|uniref:Oxygen-dependent protoporphyrinogen oxidase n=1 Tax=Chitinasiproducens palmae TaxID=1770053 RepID=A0A1H2PVA4_9BURK|nr:NAD(P)/FAD-dependent oxidoreductase [Chitinasiproducens palmae]SDV51183.1 oxygen-dependent protoporphyrinogen oxidase [Chitinasiproducens palmae]
MSLESPSVIVVGAGIAGLTAAHRLRRAGWRVTVLEAQGVVGGRMGERRDHDVVFNSGARLVYPFGEPFHRLIDELGLRGALHPLRGLGADCVGPNGVHRIALMPGPRALATPGLRMPERWRLAASALELMRLRRRVDPDWAITALEYDDVTLAEYVRSHLGPNVLSHMIEPIFRATRSFNPETLSALFYVTTAPHLLGEDTVYTFDGGMGRACQALAAGLDDVRTGASVRRIARRPAAEGASTAGAGVRIDLTDGTTLQADRAVCAVEGVLARELIDAPGQAERGMLGAVRYNALGVVHYGLNRPLPPALCFAMRGMPTRIATYQQLPAAPQAGRPLPQLYCQLTPEAADEAVARGRTGELDSLIRDELRARLPDFDTQVGHVVNQWIPRKLPVFYPGYGRRVAHFQAWQAQADAPVVYCGDWLSQALLTGACASGERAAGWLIERQLRQRQK